MDAGKSAPVVKTTGTCSKCENPGACKPHPFSEFKFKGFSFSFSKSTTDLKSCSAGFKVPLTASFPNYDKNICLPRFVAFFGVNYPFAWKTSLTISLPIQAFLIFALVLLRVEPKVWPSVSSTEIVKRVGVNLSSTYNDKGLKNSFGPLLSLLPPLSFVNILLPVLLLAPVLSLSLWHWVEAILLFFVNIFKAKTDEVTKGEPSRFLRFNKAWNYFRSKVPVLGFNIGFFSGPKGFALGHNFNFDMAPFFPLDIMKPKA